ncbi:hypothetical protein MTP99_018122 [Tenebrio molitor]|jgi:hypothetical protein|nr:hypothetical protein MTP99_018122 [Tenebrio molitor]CAH1376713.1 unnamed protein product [Tenebrio molitor]
MSDDPPPSYEQATGAANCPRRTTLNRVPAATTSEPETASAELEPAVVELESETLHSRSYDAEDADLDFRTESNCKRPQDKFALGLGAVILIIIIGTLLIGPQRLYDFFFDD